MKKVINILRKLTHTVTVMLLTIMMAVSPVMAADTAKQALNLTPIPEKPSQLYIADKAGVFTSKEKSDMHRMLSNYEKKTHNKIYLLSVNSTGDELLEIYSKRAAKEWNIASSEHTILITLSAIDYAMHIEVSNDMKHIITKEGAERMVTSHDVTYALSHRNTRCSPGVGYIYSKSSGASYAGGVWCEDTDYYIHNWYGGVEELINKVKDCIKTNGKSEDGKSENNRYSSFCHVLMIISCVSFAIIVISLAIHMLLG